MLHYSEFLQHLPLTKSLQQFQLHQILHQWFWWLSRLFNQEKKMLRDINYNMLKFYLSIYHQAKTH